jgi:NAD(P)-dependent dehydrogenase (short-subunit alcohol dehydrogenase family)
MEKKIIVITGASGGIGQSLLQGLASENHTLIGLYHQHVPALSEQNVHPVSVNLLQPEEIMSAAKTILESYGSVDVLINNAGISHSAVSWKQSLEEWQETIAVNLTAPFMLCKEFIPSMKSNGWGRIINITSIVGQTGAVGTSAYAASKAGLTGLTKTIARELATVGVTSNAIALGYFNTGMIRDVPTPLQHGIIDQIPMRRLGDPETILSTIRWLMSEEAGYVTGQVLPLNGGMFM